MSASALAAQKSAEVTEASLKLQKVAMDQWIDTEEWEAGPSHIQPNASEGDLPISFLLKNPTKFPLTLKSVILWINRTHVCTVLVGNLLLPPDNSTPVHTSIKLNGVKLAMYREHRLGLEIGGLACFVDAFKETREQLFGVSCTCGPANDGEFNVIAFIPPSQEDEENYKKRRAPNTKLGR
jgi:hypothetical protein